MEWNSQELCRLSINSRSHSTIFSLGFAFRLSIYLLDLQEGFSCLRDCEFCTYPYAQFTYCSVSIACVHVAMAYLMFPLSQLLMSALPFLIFLLCWRPFYCPCTLLASLLLLAFVKVLTFLLQPVFFLNPCCCRHLFVAGVPAFNGAHSVLTSLTLHP